MIKAETLNSAAMAVAASGGHLRRNIDSGEIALFIGATKYITLVPPVDDVSQSIGHVQDDWHNMSAQRWESYSGSVVLSNCTADDHAKINEAVERKRRMGSFLKRRLMDDHKEQPDEQPGVNDDE